MINHKLHDGCGIEYIGLGSYERALLWINNSRSMNYKTKILSSQIYLFIYFLYLVHKSKLSSAIDFKTNGQAFHGVDRDDGMSFAKAHTIISIL